MSKELATIKVVEQDSGEINFTTEFAEDVPWKAALGLMGTLISGIYQTAARLGAAKGMTQVQVQQEMFPASAEPSDESLEVVPGDLDPERFDLT
jgi:hypothetical protein